MNFGGHQEMRNMIRCKGSVSPIPWWPRRYFDARPHANLIRGGADLHHINLILVDLCLTNLHLINPLWGWPVTRPTRKKWSNNSQLEKKFIRPIFDLHLQLDAIYGKSELIRQDGRCSKKPWRVRICFWRKGLNCIFGIGFPSLHTRGSELTSVNYCRRNLSTTFLYKSPNFRRNMRDLSSSKGAILGVDCSRTTLENPYKNSSR